MPREAIAAARSHIAQGSSDRVCSCWRGPAPWRPTRLACMRRRWWFGGSRSGRPADALPRFDGRV